MAKSNHHTVKVPREVYDEIVEYLNSNRDTLKKIGIKKISHVVERAWYQFKENQVPK